MLYDGGHALDLFTDADIRELRKRAECAEERVAELEAAISAVNDAKEGTAKWWAAISRLKVVDSG